MGIIGRFLFGTVAGFAFIYTMDDYYYVTLKKHVAEPTKKELAKEQVDVAEVSKIVMRGLKQTYKELWP